MRRREYFNPAFKRWQVTYIQIDGKTGSHAFSCTGLTADQQCKLNEREYKQKIACDKDNLNRRE